MIKVLYFYYKRHRFIQFLARELGSHMLCIQKKKRERERENYYDLFVVVVALWPHCVAYMILVT